MPTPRAGYKYGHPHQRRPQHSIFSNYRIESVAENEIYLEVMVEYLLRALRSAQNATEVTMKLTKKQGAPTLSFVISSASGGGGGGGGGGVGGGGERLSRGGKKLDLVQDVPVKVLSPQQMEPVKEPVLRTIAERMKVLGEHVIISANMDGEFTIRVETDLVQVETFYKGLHNPELGELGVWDACLGGDGDYWYKRYRRRPTSYWSICN
ncbi:Hus1-like protein-domain-containing protein [Jimgerdemannia flammicorona]|uniref:Hus1-like protein-domain-containing protein n=1 Tax=Jimgerdemannia flammicorona TaxID=994334 RepID=A0A433DDB0_9FUNG|nr:Hus1-like protein-domain-containing protein [Jimgerdemannia flammicorona]